MITFLLQSCSLVLKRIIPLINMCMMILKETLAYHNSNNSIAFCTFLGATKAFYRVHYYKLLSKHADRQGVDVSFTVCVCMFVRIRISPPRI